MYLVMNCIFYFRAIFHMTTTYNILIFKFYFGTPLRIIISNYRLLSKMCHNALVLYATLRNLIAKESIHIIGNSTVIIYMFPSSGNHIYKICLSVRLFPIYSFCRSKSIVIYNLILFKHVIYRTLPQSTDMFYVSS